MPRPDTRFYFLAAAAAVMLVSLTLWLRLPGFGLEVWNVDEAIHATVARSILAGGVLYRDAIDQRTPLTYYVVAGIFSLAGENNIWAMHFLGAILIAASAWLLCLTGRTLHSWPTGLWTGLLYVLFSCGLLYPSDANALNTEWFVSFFTSVAAWLFWRSPGSRNQWTLAGIGVLFSLAFLSKQPGATDLAAPVATLAYLAWRERTGWLSLLQTLAALFAGFFGPILAVLAIFAPLGAWHDLVFYTWTYNLHYYGPAENLAARMSSVVKLAGLLTDKAAIPSLVGTLVAAAFAVRLVQKDSTERARPENPGMAYVLVWLGSSVVGAAAGGRGFDHYYIQCLPPICLLIGWGCGILSTRACRRDGTWWFRIAAVLLLLALFPLFNSARAAAFHSQLPGPSLTLGRYIREHTHPDDRVFVWGYQPELYLFSGRRAASRFIYDSFLSGMIPWENVAPGIDTSSSIVPGAWEALQHDLEKSPPAYIVDCSVGANRHWDKYPLEQFPYLSQLVREHYKMVEAGQFLTQGFGLYQRRDPADRTEPAPPELSPITSAQLILPVVTEMLRPLHASAPFGAALTTKNGQVDLFGHAPSSFTYRIPANVNVIRGGFGFAPGAYAATNPTPTDGAEFSILWKSPDGVSQVLLQRLLRPRENAEDRSIHFFRVDLPAGANAEIEFRISPGPTGNSACDWTFWRELRLENSR